MHDLPGYFLMALIAAAFFAGFVDSIAGGGGLITIPVLLIAGFPPVAALGTNKLQGMFGAASATWSYQRHGHVSLRPQLLSALLAFAAQRNNDKVGLTLFTERVEKYVPPAKGQRHALRVVRDILHHEPAARGGDLRHALALIAVLDGAHHPVVGVIEDDPLLKFWRDLEAC